MKLTRRHWDILASVLIAVLLSSSVTLCMTDALDMSVRVSRILLFAGATAVWCALLVWNRPARAVGLLLGGAGVFCLFRFAGAGAELQVLLRTVAGLAAGGEGSVAEAEKGLRAVLAITFSLVGFGLSRLQGGVYPAATISVAMALIGWRISYRMTPLYTAPGALALVLMYANAGERRTGYWKALPVAAVITALAILFTPLNRPTWEPLERAAEKIRQMFEDYFFFTDARTAYSLAADGYQVMGDRLGGPASPREGAVMLVETDEKLLLRGSVRKTYTGVSWADGGVNSRYLYLDPTRLSTRNSVFCVKFNDFLPGHEKDVAVTFLADGISTLFVPARLAELKLPIDVAAYYNDLGDVFITRGVLEGDRYTMTVFLPEEGNGLRQALLEAAQREDKGYDDALNNYLALPRGISQRVYAMAEEIAQGCETPYDTALAIRDYLLRNYKYELQVEYPPANRDFVSWFLLDAKEGYCSYFATAMAVMCRMAGLPARYVEGYQVKPDGTGEVQVDGSDAHAWVEVYFQGAGWLSFDPTPGFDWTQPEGPNPQPTPAPEGEDENEASPEPDPTPEPEGGDPTPEPDAPEDEPDSQPEPTPTPPPEEDGPEATPTPPPVMPPSSDQPPSPPENSDRSFPWWLLAILAALAVAAIAAWRVRVTDPIRRAEKVKDADGQLMLWYLSLNNMLETCGYFAGTGESPAAFAARLEGAGPWSEAYSDFAQAVCRRRYGGKKPAQEDIRLAQAAYRVLWRSMNRRQKARYLTRRALSRMPNLKRVP